MSYTYANRKRTDSTAPQKETAVPQPSMDALRTGAAVPTQEQMGHRVDLPDAIRAKMEESFGANLSAVKLYESEAVSDAGAKAITQGSNIAFAPGMLDFTSQSGQALLGHEMSHVVSQARGEVTGGGFLNDYSLEARADREGAMAAAGEQIAMPTASLSPVTAAAAAGPMQAKDKPTYADHHTKMLDYEGERDMAMRAALWDDSDGNVEQGLAKARTFGILAKKEELAAGKILQNQATTPKDRMSSKADVEGLKSDLYGLKASDHLLRGNSIRNALYSKLAAHKDAKSKRYRAKADAM